MLSLEQIEQVLPSWIVSQRWFSKTEHEPSSVRIIQHEQLIDGPTSLMWMIVEVDNSARYQVPVGIRAVDDNAVLLGRAQARIAELDNVVIYDALVDSTMALAIFERVTGKPSDVTTVRPMDAEQSNTSLIFDDRLILKVFRRLQPGSNPDSEVTEKLSDIEFPHVPRVVASWRRDDYDLAVCQPYLTGGTDGWSLALGAIEGRLESGESRGSFANEARELGAMTGRLHVALAKVLPTSNFDPLDLVDALEKEAQVLDENQRNTVISLCDDLRSLKTGECGLATRVHGDFHLGQTLKTDAGWFLFDFEGEPTRPMSERTQLVSPVKDVTGMLRSFDYATAAGLGEQTRQLAEAHGDLASAWGRENRQAFLDGYFASDGIDELMPAKSANRDLLMRGFEVQKAIYELQYERAYRPDWVSIPEGALKQLLG